MNSTVNLYLVPVVSGIFTLALCEATPDDKGFYLEFLDDKDNAYYDAILSTRDGKHYAIDGVILKSGALDYIGEYVADHARTNTTVEIRGEDARKIGKIIRNYRKERDIRLKYLKNEQLLHLTFVEA